MKKSLAVVALSALISLASSVVFADDTATQACLEKDGVVSLANSTDGSCVDSKGVVHTFKDSKEVEASN
ncbi:MAG: hypothetical protein AB8U25_03175 [Rickettsiales endosymbiont of Dermacentor nuttalli]